MLAFIQQYMRERRISPLIREVQSACQISSYKSAVDRLNALEHKGFIKRTPNKHRGIRMLSQAVEQISDIEIPLAQGAGDGLVG